MKVSREGVVLIKSFAGFRSRAVRSEDGRWVIGYGHTASAREGLVVAEADAELLLQYDLLPVVKNLNRGIGRPVNQHQFDALASFALSIGVDRFLGSDVLQRLNDGLPTQAADALIGWPAPVPLDAATRRRIAERALFNADPDQPVHLADLLIAPLAPPTTEPETIAPPVAAVAARAAAVATLLGEPTEAEAPPVATEAPAETAEPVAPEPETTTVPSTPSPAPVATEAPVSISAPGSLHLQRYLPYAAGIVGPLPGVTTVPATPTAAAEPAAPAVDHAAAEPVAMNVEMAAAVEPEISTPETLIVAEPSVEPAALAAAPSPAPSTEIMETGPATGDTLVTPFATAAAVPATAPALVLTPASTDPAPAEDRPAWPDAQRQDSPPNQEPLFVEEPAVSVLRHEVEPDTPARFEKSQTGAFLIMGGVGLLASAFSAAAFRLALQEPSPMGETTVVAWTLAVIGGVCVVVSSLNLYMRWGRAQQDGTEPS
ncbi:glycoside hydrolase family protein [uncultured Brevundimonas sp.]|uniref:lysozyme n=1 Tax=uncultured Brevundimonas sp. TaxID=213418 RepID=UPI0030EF8CC3|tara:strand:+ start:1274 stop:2734 length:1461 start_codon:yes stop_codon:yes gene_type:complete